MKITKKILLLILLFLIVGCSEKEDKTSILMSYNWKADSTQIIDGIQGADETTDYTLIFTDKEFILYGNENTVTGTYKIDEDNNVTLSANKVTTKCKLKTNEITCDKYAKKFTKIEPEK